MTTPYYSDDLVTLEQIEQIVRDMTTRTAASRSQEGPLTALSAARSSR